MEKDKYIGYATAGLAVQKGYDVNCDRMYVSIDNDPYGEKKEELSGMKGWHSEMVGVLPAPEKEKLQKWLRDKHNLFVWVEYMFFDDWQLLYNIAKADDEGVIIVSEEEYESWEDALEAGLIEGLKLI